MWLLSNKTLYAKPGMGQGGPSGHCSPPQSQVTDHQVPFLIKKLFKAMSLLIPFKVDTKNSS
jgi:hypothetical protein